MELQISVRKLTIAQLITKLSKWTKGQSHHMFSRFLNIWIYDLFSRNFLSFVFLQGATVWPWPIWIKVRSWWQILPQHQSTCPRDQESALMEISPFRPHFIKFSKTIFYEVNLASQCSHLEELLVSRFGPNSGRDLIFVDNEPKFYAVLVMVLGFFQFSSDCCLWPDLWRNQVLLCPKSH